MKSPYLELKEQFYEMIGAITIEEIVSNQPLIQAIERMSRMLVSATQ